jgi:fatty-acyl-CoA synthase
VTDKPGMEHVTEEEINEYSRNQLARIKVPKTVVFGPLPKTSTGKMQKFILRERAKQL